MAESRHPNPDFATQLRHVQEAIVDVAKRAAADDLATVRQVEVDLRRSTTAARP